ncbi:hypothetical protein [Polaromonas sp.]|uniref:Secreted protein n=1 Tax=Polaromonas aquatica TaxID=332657 RepID=A0ABW1TUK8_9BURK
MALRKGLLVAAALPGAVPPRLTPTILFFFRNTYIAPLAETPKNDFPPIPGSSLTFASAASIRACTSCLLNCLRAIIAGWQAPGAKPGGQRFADRNLLHILHLIILFSN